jgi:hypothetical protein
MTETAKEFKYEFKDTQGNSLMYLHVISSDGGTTGKVTLHFSQKKDPREYETAMKECKHFARMLNIPYKEMIDG